MSRNTAPDCAKLPPDANSPQATKPPKSTFICSFQNASRPGIAATPAIVRRNALRLPRDRSPAPTGQTLGLTDSGIGFLSPRAGQTCAGPCSTLSRPAAGIPPSLPQFVLQRP
jgi:hypothetical protein